MSKYNARQKAQQAKSELNSMRIITLETLDEVHSALKKVHRAASDLADAVLELAKE